MCNLSETMHTCSRYFIRGLSFPEADAVQIHGPDKTHRISWERSEWFLIQGLQQYIQDEYFQKQLKKYF